MLSARPRFCNGYFLKASRRVVGSRLLVRSVGGLDPVLIQAIHRVALAVLHEWEEALVGGDHFLKHELVVDPQGVALRVIGARLAGLLPEGFERGVIQHADLGLAVADSQIEVGGRRRWPISGAAFGQCAGFGFIRPASGLYPIGHQGWRWFDPLLREDIHQVAQFAPAGGWQWRHVESGGCGIG